LDERKHDKGATSKGVSKSSKEGWNDAHNNKVTQAAEGSQEVSVPTLAPTPEALLRTRASQQTTRKPEKQSIVEGITRAEITSIFNQILEDKSLTPDSVTCIGLTVAQVLELHVKAFRRSKSFLKREHSVKKKELKRARPPP
jgi:hypothetical protein